MKKILSSFQKAPPRIREPPVIVQTSYESDPVDVPDDFLVKQPDDAQPILAKLIDFKTTPLPEYDGCFALILENVLSPIECAQLVSLAEQSAKTRGWKPAMVNAGPNQEVLETDYRNSDRIIWDSKEMVDRLWKRCIEAEGVEDMLAKVAGNASVQSPKAAERGDSWTFTRLNERMRFLRYGPGQFFDRHCDGSYVNEQSPQLERSLFTFHLYLTNDEGLKGGATSFHDPNHFYSRGGNDYHVNAKLGRVLIFQHRSLLHSGQEVSRGKKITMRTDLMYLLDEQEVPLPKD